MATPPSLQEKSGLTQVAADLATPRWYAAGFANLDRVQERFGARLAKSAELPVGLLERILNINGIRRFLLQFGSSSTRLLIIIQKKLLWTQKN